MSDSNSATNDFDVIVCGAGPAGSSCAARLGERGYAVLLLDKAKFPRDKTCGDGVSGKSLGMLRQLGILDKVASAPNAVVNAITFSSPDSTILRIDVPVIDGKQRAAGYVCRRQVFDNILFSNAKSKKSVTTMENTEVVDLVRAADSVQVVGVKVKSTDGSTNEFRSKVVVGADGANSVVARKLGVGTNDDRHWCMGVRQYWEGVKGLSDAIELHFVDAAIPGYFWIFPSDGGRANVGLGIILADKKKKKLDNLQQLMNEIITKEPLFAKRFANAKPVGPFAGWNLPLASQKRKNYFSGALLVGDAASLIDPFTGEGIGNALMSGSIAAEAIDAAFTDNDFSENSLKRYWDLLWREIGPEVESSYDLQKRIKIRWLFNWVIRKAATKPEVREAIAGTFINADARKSYRSPLFYLRLFWPF